MLLAETYVFPYRLLQQIARNLVGSSGLHSGVCFFLWEGQDLCLPSLLQRVLNSWMQILLFLQWSWHSWARVPLSLQRFLAMRMQIALVLLRCLHTMWVQRSLCLQWVLNMCVCGHRCFYNGSDIIGCRCYHFCNSFSICGCRHVVFRMSLTSWSAVRMF